MKGIAELPFLVDKQTYDYGIIILDNDLGNTTGWLGLNALPDTELIDANIITIGSGGDKPRHTLWKSPGHIQNGDAPEIVNFDVDVFGGNSGGPVFKKDDPTNIIALINQGRGEYAEDGYPNSGLRIRQEIIDAVETVANGGTLPRTRIIEDNSN